MPRTTTVTAHHSAGHGVRRHERRLPERHGNTEPTVSLTPAPVLVTVSDLTSCPGWTKASIGRFLGEPDQLKRNPRYASAAPMRLYDEARIAAVEATDEWAVWLEKSSKRSSAAQHAAETASEKRAAAHQAEAVELIAQMSDLDSGHSMGGFTVTAARETARAHYDRLWLDRYAGRGDLKKAEDDAPADFVDRITVNYLRHVHTDYDRLLAIGARNDVAHTWLRNRVLDQIAERFPELAVECDRQRYSKDLVQRF